MIQTDGREFMLSAIAVSVGAWGYLFLLLSFLRGILPVCVCF
jgi:hypothetical protein